MLRIPLEDYNLPKYDDAEIINSWKWFMSFISEKDWKVRKENIEKKILVNFKEIPPFSESLSEGTLMVVKDDVIGWYLYLLDMLINEPHKYEYFQGARVVPIFKRFGVDLDLLKNIDGINERIRSLVKKRKSEADALLFEILTALLWARNGYKVIFLEEQTGKKTPDLEARKGDKIFNIECKRQSKTSVYTYRETTKRQKMISYISKSLLEKNILLDIVFHIELEILPDTFLKDLLDAKLKSPKEGKIVSNSQVDIDLKFVNIPYIKNYLKSHYVKNHSPMLNYLISKKPIDNKGFTCGIYANFFRVGEGEVNNLYISDISSAFGVFWNCDAKEALCAKARNIKSQVNSALQQFNSENTAVIHVGLETFDGPEVEMKRFEKIKEMVENISPEDNKLRWIFCNFFQAYSPPDQDWVFDETVTTITSYVNPILPIETTLMIVPDDENVSNDISHWERSLP